MVVDTSEHARVLVVLLVAVDMIVAFVIHVHGSRSAHRPWLAERREGEGQARG